MKRFRRELIWTVLVLVTFLWLVLSIQSRRFEALESSAKNLLQKTQAGIGSDELQQLKDREAKRYASYARYVEEATQPTDYELDVLAADSWVAGFSESEGRRLQTFIVEHGHPDLNARQTRLLQDLAAHKDQFVFEEPDSPVIQAGPIRVGQKTFHAAVLYSRPGILESAGWFLPFAFGLCLLLGYQVLGLQRARRKSFAPFSTRAIPVLALLFMAQIFWLRPVLQSQNEAMVRQQIYRAEVAMLRGRQSLPVKLSYQSLRDVLPFTEDAVYRIREQQNLYLIQPHQQRLRGFKLSSTSPILSYMLVWALGLILFLMGLRTWGRRFFQDAQALKSQLQHAQDSFEWTPPHCRDPDFQAVAQGITEALWDLQKRDAAQRLRAQDILAHFVRSLGLKEGTLSFETQCFGLLVRPREIEAFERLSSRDCFDAASRWIRLTKECVEKLGGVVVREQGLSLYVVFADASLGRVLLQRALVAALDIAARVRSHRTVLGSAGFCARIENGVLEAEVMDLQTRKDVLFGGSLMERLSEADDTELLPGVYLPLRLKDEARTLVFDVTELQDELRVDGLKSLHEHLELLQQPNSQLRAPALELAGLQPDLQTLEAVLQSLPEFTQSEKEQAIRILGVAIQNDDGRVRVDKQVRTWLESEDPGLRKLALFLYGRLDLMLGSSEAARLLEFEELLNDHELLALILKHWQGTTRPEWAERLENSTPEIRAEWAWQTFVRFHELSGLETILEILESPETLRRTSILVILSRLRDCPDEIRSRAQNWLNPVRSRFYSVLQGILRSREDREEQFCCLAVIGAWGLGEAVEDLVHEVQQTLDRDLKREIRDTLILLGADRFLISSHVLQ